MSHGNDIADVFGDFAGNLVNDYITEVSTITRQHGRRPSYEELLQMLKLLNEELTFKAVKTISRIKQRSNNDVALLIQDYKAIIRNSVTRLCDEAAALIVSPS